MSPGRTCPACGAEIVEGEDTCPECGSDLFELGIHTPSVGSMEERLLKEKVKNLPLRPTIAVSPDTPPPEVLAKMKEGGVGCALVVEPARPYPNLLGVLTDRTILASIRVENGRFSIAETTAGEVARHKPETVREDDPRLRPLQDEPWLLPHRCSPSGRASLLSVRDILSYFAQQLQAQA